MFPAKVTSLGCQWFGAIPTLRFDMGEALTATPPPRLLRGPSRLPRKPDGLALFDYVKRSELALIRSWRGARPELPSRLGVARAVMAQPKQQQFHVPVTNLWVAVLGMLTSA
jgi:hypothetical protein